jgi:hypothetical protein
MERQIEVLPSDALVATLTRLRDILVEENELLESGKSHDHQRYVNGKNQILRELIVCQRALPNQGTGSIIQEQLVSVRKLVDRNYNLLRSHVDAMSELTSILTDIEVAEDADGTYSKSQM